MGSRGFSSYPLAFKKLEEALGHHIVITVTPAAHAGMREKWGKHQLR